MNKIKNITRLILDPQLGAKVRAWVRVMGAIIAIVAMLRTNGVTEETVVGAVLLLQAALSVAVATPTTPPTKG